MNYFQIFIYLIFTFTIQLFIPYCILLNFHSFKLSLFTLFVSLFIQQHFMYFPHRLYHQFSLYRIKNLLHLFTFQKPIVYIGLWLYRRPECNKSDLSVKSNGLFEMLKGVNTNINNKDTTKKMIIHELHHRHISSHDRLEFQGFFMNYMWWETFFPLIINYYLFSVSFYLWFYFFYLSFLDHMIAHQLCHLNLHNNFHSFPKFVRLVHYFYYSIHKKHHENPLKYQYSGFNIMLDLLYGTYELKWLLHLSIT
jgi:hypothetical protein